jgi:catechol 2,3-dioxygenase-like lactoylglutathione lyase family enzyme
MLDHVGYPVSDYGRSKAFYLAALKPLGYGLVMEVTDAMSGGQGDHAGFGAGRPDFWIGTGKAPACTVHLAFQAADRAQVDAFHAAALAAGGTDNGAPGLRPHYHANYYGAFVLDPDGNNVEAVCHAPV